MIADIEELADFFKIDISELKTIIRLEKENESSGLAG